MPQREPRAERTEQIREDYAIAAELMRSNRRQVQELMSKPVEHIRKRDIRRARKLIRDRRK